MSEFVDVQYGSDRWGEIAVSVGGLSDRAKLLYACLLLANHEAVKWAMPYRQALGRLIPVYFGKEPSPDFQALYEELRSAKLVEARA